MLLAKSAVHSQNADEVTCSLLNDATLCKNTRIGKSSVILHAMLDTTNVQCSPHNSNTMNFPLIQTFKLFKTRI